MTAPDIGVFLPSMTARDGTFGDLVAAGRHAEHLGFESAWVVDQLVAGTGVPLIDSTITLAAAAAATERIKLALGVLIVPLRPVVWIAKQIASLQHLSHDRIILGVGAGGDRHNSSWAAAGVPRRERGRRTDQALGVLPALIAGRATTIDSLPGSPEVQLSPAATVPPIVVGGMSEAAMNRAAKFGDGWFLVPVPPNEAARGRARLEELAAAHGRATPAMIGSVMAAIEGDPSLPSHDAIVGALADPDGVYGIPAEHVDSMLLHGGPDAIASRVHELGLAGATRVVVTLTSGDWFRQAELLAEARALLD